MTNDRENRTSQGVTIPRDLQAKRQFWQTEVKQWQASGQSQREYSESRGLSASQLSYWINQFSLARSASSSSSASCFTPIRVKQEASLSCIRVRRPNGVCIDLPPLEDSTQLKTLLEMLIC